MPAQRRLVTVAPGHIVKACRTPQASDRPGFVRIRVSYHRPPFDVAERLWNEAPIA